MSDDHQTERLATTSDNDVLLTTFTAMLKPLARLAVAHGMPCHALDDVLKQAFVDAARQALVDAGLPEHRLVSRISTSTGIHRREVTRLTTQAPQAARPASKSLAAEVLAQWLSDHSLHDEHGALIPLKRQGPAPSFEALARSVTQDVHPRSVLEELCRLRVVAHDQAEDTVSLLRASFVPDGDKPQMLAFLADNVGDHLSGAVQNVIGQTTRKHFDQAVFADELSAESLNVIRQFVSRQWQGLLREAVPLLEQRIEADRATPHTAHHRLRIGLYSFDEAMQTPPASSAQKDDHEK